MGFCRFNSSAQTSTKWPFWFYIVVIFVSQTPLTALGELQVSVQVTAQGQAPTSTGVTVEALGNGRYRGTVSSNLANTRRVFINYQILNPRDPEDCPVNPNSPDDHVACLYTASADFDHLAQGGESLSDITADLGGFGPELIEEGTARTVSVSLDWTQADGTERTESYTRQYTVPTSPVAVSHFIDLAFKNLAGDVLGTVSPLIGGGQSQFEFQKPANADRVIVSGLLRGEGGDDLEFSEMILLPNTEPVLKVAQLLDVSQTTFTAVVAVQAVDADGDDLTFTIDWGDGEPAVTSEGGIAVHQFPLAAQGIDPYQDYDVNITVDDGQGGTANQQLVVRFPKPQANRDPVFDDPGVTSLEQGDRTILVTASASDPDGDDLTYTFTWGDGTANTVSAEGVASHTYENFGVYNLTVTASDGNDGSVSDTQAVAFQAPAANQAPVFQLTEIVEQDGFTVLVAVHATDEDGDALSYTFDWGDGRPQTETGGGVATHTYPSEVDTSYTISVSVSDGRGGSDSATLAVDYPAPAANVGPVMERFVEVDRDDFRVVVAASATDADGDQLTYTFDWKDGSLPDVVQGGVVAHTYPADVYAVYGAEVTVSDGRGGSVSDTLSIEFIAPAVNVAPSFDLAEVLDRDGFTVRVVVNAVDPDGDPLTYEYEWGDGSLNTQASANVARHDFPADVHDDYTITVTASDGRGGKAETTIPVEFIAPPANQAPTMMTAEIVSIEAFEVVLGFHADDADEDNITYTIDWGDGRENTVTQGNVAGHTYPEGVFRSYEIQVTASDGQDQDSGLATVEFTAPPENTPPVFDVAEIINETGFSIVVAGHANDVDGDEISYTFQWGDGSTTTNQGGVAAHTYPLDVYQVYPIRVVADDGQGGIDEVNLSVGFVAPPENVAPVIESLEFLPIAGFDVSATVNAVDPDGDILFYTFDWGDGSDPDVSRNGVDAHNYAEGVLESYTLTVTVADGRGGIAQQSEEVVFPANNAPAFEVAELIHEDDFKVVIAVHATDDDGHSLAYRVQWDDGTPDTVSNGGIVQHQYAQGVYTAYTILVVVDDDNGGQDQLTIDVDFPEPKPNEGPVFDTHEILDMDDFTVAFAVNATDPEGDPIEYTFDWGHDGLSTTRAGGVISHAFPEGVYTSYIVRVTASDGDDALDAIAVIAVDFPDPPVNRQPIFESLNLLEKTDFTVQLAVNATDPDGDMLTYEVDWGDGTDPESFLGGQIGHAFPDDVYDTYSVNVTASDPDGLTDEIQIQIEFPPPAVNQPPVLEHAEILVQDAFEIVISASGRDPENGSVTYSFDWGDGTDVETSSSSVALHQYPAEYNKSYTVTVTVNDAESAQASASLQVHFPAPPPNVDPLFEDVQFIERDGFEVSLSMHATDADGDGLTYEVDWGDGNPVESSIGGIERHIYPQDVYATYTITVIVDDGRGGTDTAVITVDFPEPPPNIEPEIELVRVLKHDGFEVSAFIGAHDEDGDVLSYAVDWGDGTAVTIGDQNIASHVYADGVYQTYTVTATVDDGQGGQATSTATVEYPVPPPNEVPHIDAVEAHVGSRGEVRVTVAAWDPEGHQLSYGVHWGDEATTDELSALPGGTALHQYPLPSDGTEYLGYVVVTDTEGGESRANFAVHIVDEPTLIRELNAQQIADGIVEISVVAEDADGIAFLTYDFDLDGDGIFETVDRALSSMIHTYEESGAHAIEVRVHDTWSGSTVSRAGEVFLSDWVPGDASPVVLGVSTEVGPRGLVALRINGFDPEGQPLAYSVHWGDEVDPETVEALDHDVVQHTYDFPSLGTGYTGYVVVEDAVGQVAQARFDVAIADSPTSIGTIESESLGEGAYRLSVVAHDPDSPAGLTYNFDFDGDGEVDVGPTVLNSAVHRYATPGAYVAQVTVFDPWSQQETARSYPIEVGEWVPEDLPPVIDDIAIEVGPRGTASLAVDARDPEGGALGIFVHWGDEAEDSAETVVVGSNAAHNYAYPSDAQSYSARVRVVDATGQEASRQIAVEIVDQETIINEVSTQQVRELVWLIEVDAVDPDAPTDLLYAFDFDNDGVWDFENQSSSSAVHTFSAVGTYTVRVGVMDPWSGDMVETVTQVGVASDFAGNLPPSIGDVEVIVGPSGLVNLEFSASDPERGQLVASVLWGESEDEDPEVLEGFLASHRYSYQGPSVEYQGVILVRDIHGATARKEFLATVVDSPTVIRDMSMSVVSRGRVYLSLVASDPDAEELRYSFDMDGDGVFDVVDRARGELFHDYDQGGTYTVRVSVTDTWSGISTTSEQAFVVERWVDEVPLATDFVEGLEGQCMVFRVADGEVTSAVNAEVCERDENPDMESWRWDFGDGAVARGSQVGHRFVDDGVFTVTVTGGTEENPLSSTLEVSIANGPPVFVSAPIDQATANAEYQYALSLTDPGALDQIRVELTAGPESMALSQNDDGDWTLTWRVPPEASDQANVELLATDGHFIDDEWVADGGEAIQSFVLNIDGPYVEEVEVVEPEPDPPSFEDYGGDGFGCRVTFTEKVEPVWAIWAFLCFGVLLRRRRRANS